MTLTIIFASLAIILTFIFIVNHWKGILKMLLAIFIGYLAVGCLWDALHGHISGVVLIAVGLCFFSLLKSLLKRL